MNKPILLAILVAAFAVQVAHAEPAPVDFVVLLDTSESMLPYWNQTTNYLIKDIITNQLHTGDSFHLISFSSHPEVEVSQQIQNRQNIQTILARLLLLQPLGRYTDLVAAIKYLYQYTIDLPISTQKEILILTDGIDDPPPGSPFPIKYGPNGQDVSGNRQQIIDTAKSMLRHGWNVHIIQYPLQGQPAPGAAAQGGTQLLSGAPSGANGTVNASGGGATTSGGKAAVSPAGAATATGTTSATSGARATTAAGSPSGSAPSGPTSASVGGAAGPSASPAGTPAAGGGVASASSRQSGTSSANEAGGAGLLNQLSQTLGVPIQQFQQTTNQNLAHVATGAPLLTFPGNLGKVGSDLTAPFKITNFQTQPVLIQLASVMFDGADILRRSVTLPVPSGGSATMKVPLHLPASLQPGPHTIPIALQFSGGLRISPSEGNLSFTLARGLITAQNLSSVVLPVLIGILIVIVILLIVMFVRRLVARMSAAPSTSLAAQVRFDVGRSSIRPIELRVAGQNPNIGGRNIHPIGAGARRTIGGGTSSFLIYLYPVPAHVAEITHDGDGYVFVPVKAEYFPTLNGPLRNCLGKEIQLRTAENRMLALTLREYLSPLDEVNRIMHLVDKAGLPARSQEDLSPTVSKT